MDAGQLMDFRLPLPACYREGGSRTRNAAATTEIATRRRWTVSLWRWWPSGLRMRWPALVIAVSRR